MTQPQPAANQTAPKLATASNVSGMRIAVTADSWIDRTADYFSDWCSPILIKETRQALKSRQFFWTFFLLLVAVAFWTIVGLTFNDARAGLSDAGPNLLSGYLVILGFPLAIVIPFGTYRSLAREYEDGTIQLVSITTMKAWQIVAGKLGSSMMQLVVYCSVIAPCVAFTYLLRGVSLPEISISLLLCVAGSVCLSCLALFGAGATRSRVYSVGVSILLILTQFLVYFFWCMFAVAMASGEFGTGFDGPELPAFTALSLTILSTAALLFSAAASFISFESDNRSTLIRIMMLVQQLVFFVVVFVTYCFTLEEWLITMFTFFAAHYWLIMGFLLVSENEVMSSRVKRQIPKSMMGRWLVFWLLPGSGCGLIFSTINIWFCGLCVFLTFWLSDLWLSGFSWDEWINFTQSWPSSFSDLREYAMSTAAICLYSSFFLAITYLLCAFIRRTGHRIHGVLSLALGVVVVFLFTCTPLVYHYNAVHSSNWDEYTADQVFNWYWTCTELTTGSISTIPPALFIFAAAAMLIVCAVAWNRAAIELTQTRELVPERLQQEIAAEQPAVARIPVGESIEEIFGSIDDEQKDVS